MSLLEICFCGLFLLYAVILYRILSNAEGMDKRIEVIYGDLIGHLENLRQRHNLLVDEQKSFMEESPKFLIKAVNKEIEDANERFQKKQNLFINEMNDIKEYIAHTLIRR